MSTRMTTTDRRCLKCGEPKVQYDSGQRKCPPCDRAYALARYHRKKQDPAWAAKQKKHNTQARAAWAKRNRSKVNAYSVAWRKNNLERRKRTEKASRRRYKIEALIAYGGREPRCSCCGEDTFEFLTIDHVNGDGAAHRKLIGKGAAIYRWLKKNRYPEGFGVLCMNCNHAKGVYGVCPHQRKVVDD